MIARKLGGSDPEFNVERTVEVNGCRLYLKRLGHGPPVIVLHGGPGAQHDYLLPAFGRLADEYRLCFYDQRGGGRSQVERPREIGWRDHVADLEALRSELGLDSLMLLGYSWGGLLALLYATEYPERVRAMALVAPAAAWGEYPRRFKENFAQRSQAEAIRQMRAELEASGLKESDQQAYRRRRFDLSVAGYFRDPRQAFDSSPFVVQLQAQQATWASLKGYGADLRRKLQTLKVPTLILHGRYDPIPIEWAEELADVLQASRLIVLENSGHVPYVEEAERTLGAICRFLGEITDR